MNLPPLTIPDIPLPFAVPEMMHPAIVHFAVALPVVIILMELINLFARRRSIGSISFVLLLLMVLVYFGAYLTGSVDAERAKDLISPDTKTLLDAHKNGGIWLVYSAAVLLVIKLISAGVNKFPARVVFLVAMGLFFWGATGVVQKGCALTYKHGVNVKVPTSQAAKQVVEEVSREAEKKIEELKEKTSEAATKVEEATKNAAQKAEEATVKAVETLKEKSSEAVQNTKEAASKTVETIKEKAKEIKEKTKETIEKAIQPSNTQTPAPKVTPVETVPAG